MKKNRKLVLILVVFFGVGLISSCYTSKKGIVPCPHGKMELKSDNLGEINIQPV